MSADLERVWRRARSLVLPAATLVFVAGVSVGVEGIGLGPLAALASGVAAGLLAGGGVAWMRERRAALEQAEAERAARQARQEAAWRLFWEASSDFRPGAWGRTDLEALRLLCLNLGPGMRLGSRVTARLRDAVSRVLAGALDRLGDLLVTGRQLAGDHRAVHALEAAIPALVEELEGVTCVPGQPVPFDPARVARVCTDILEACDLLRDGLGGRVVADLRAVLSWLGRERFREQVERGELLLPGGVGPEAPPRSGRLLVVARAPDLVAALDEGMTRMLEYGMPVGPVRVVLEETARGRVLLAFAWQAADRLEVEPRKILPPFLPLRSYGAVVRAEEIPAESRIRLLVELDVIGEPSSPAEANRAHLG